MIAGHDLHEGLFDPRQLNTDEIWQNLSTLFTTRSRNSTSYTVTDVDETDIDITHPDDESAA